MIRPFQPGDAQGCCDLIRSCIEGDLSLTGELREALLQAESPESMRARARAFYVAVDQDGEEITSVGGLDLNEVRILCVAAGHRGKGIGRRLLQHLQDMVPPSLFSDIFVYSAPGAVGFYAANGFAARGPHTFVVRGMEMRTEFMAKQLRGDAYAHR